MKQFPAEARVVRCTIEARFQSEEMRLWLPIGWPVHLPGWWFSPPRGRR